MAGGTTDAEERFAFGENWRDFSRTLTPEKIMGARDGIARLLGTDDLSGRTFLDVGCGSGLMSLAAHRMGANVTAFDYDPASVSTSVAVRDAHAGPDAYPVMQGSALDAEFVRSLGTFDVVYSWGVLHHTGDLWGACQVVTGAVAPGGLLALAIYNDQGLPSRVWTRVKKAYVEGGRVRRQALLAGYAGYFRARDLVALALAARHGLPCLGAEQRAMKSRGRGMDRRHDLVDWVGGYPFEVAKPEDLFRFYRERGFTLLELTTCRGSLGCNEFVFRRGD